MKKLLLSLLFCVAALLPAWSQRPALIPAPVCATWPGGTFRLAPGVSVSCADAALQPAAAYLARVLGPTVGLDVRVRRGKGAITLRLDTALGAGAYRLRVGQQGIDISAGDAHGAVWAISTLRQLLPARPAWQPAAPKAGEKGCQVACVDVQDKPRFQWRGMMLDVSRHFFSVAEVEELLDLMALYKLNRLHWHLTDDQGWRVEIKKYPLLTQRGGWRTYNNQDSICMGRAKAEDNAQLQLPAAKLRQSAEGTQYGGYYTQEDIRTIVAYAQERGIDVVPEVDMPGHFLAAINNYDGLSCFPERGWGRTFSTPLCPGKDKMLAFCEDVWAELLPLFPCKYVHIGGDEVEKTNWKRCPDCQKRMQDNGLKTEEELQAWFIHHMERFFNQHGRQMIGWDEIIDGGLSQTSTVMWWRSWATDAPERTTAHGNHLICTPNEYFYLDYAEDRRSLGKLYGFEPAATLPAALVDGVQCNLWTEQVPSREQMLYMAVPRIIACAELGWSPAAAKDFGDFRRRLAQHYPRLAALGVPYRLPDLTGFDDVNVFTDRDTLRVACPDPAAEVRYTDDGTLPTRASRRLDAPVVLSQSRHLRLRSFGQNGRPGTAYNAEFRKEDFAPAAQRPDTLQPGLRCYWHDYAGTDCAGIDQAPLAGTYIINKVEIPAEAKGNIGLRVEGWIEVPADGIYTFRLLSDDGSWLKIDGQMTVDNDGEHAPVEKVGQHAMRAGLHPLALRYFDHNGGVLRLRVTDAQGHEARIAFSH